MELAATDFRKVRRWIMMELGIVKEDRRSIDKVAEVSIIDRIQSCCNGCLRRFRIEKITIGDNCGYRYRRLWKSPPCEITVIYA